MYTIRVAPTGQTFNCKPEEDLLQTARRSGIKIPSGCRSGGCGMCKIRVVQGHFVRGPSSMAVLPQEERADHYTLACRTYPQGDLDIELIKGLERI